MFVNTLSTKNNQVWKTRLFNAFKKNIKNGTFDNVQLARQMRMSERQLFRKIKEITGVSPQKFLRHFRLNQAMIYLKNGNFLTVRETAYAVGFINVSYFIAQFYKKYEKKPLQILKEQGWR